MEYVASERNIWDWRTKMTLLEYEHVLLEYEYVLLEYEYVLYSVWKRESESSVLLV